MDCALCKKELIKVKNNWWFCPECQNNYSAESFSQQGEDKQGRV